VASELRASLAAWLVVVLGVSGCAGSLRKYPLREPLWNDPDRQAIDRAPKKYYSPFAWDAANHTLFRPVSRFFAVDPAGEAVNVNALDEVPDSSWFTNRVGRFPLPVDAAAIGACSKRAPSQRDPWVIIRAKPNGFNPGFFVEIEGQKYLMKFDGTEEGTRPTAADVIGTRIFHAAGYFVPCNRIVFFERKLLTIGNGARGENSRGEKAPLTESDVERVLAKALRLTDGRYRASVSQFIEGTPLGPWTYEGTRADDPNDVIPHEDRRELRGMYALAAWLGYYDSREQNTMASFVQASGGGYVRHYMLDVGNVFGSVWDPPLLGRRITHAYYLDFPYLFEDFVTLGARQRPWDRLRFGPTGKQFGYYDVTEFDPDAFRPGYPNPAFVRRSERDSAWMARIVSRISERHIRSIVAEAQLAPAHEKRLLEVVFGRRKKLLSRFLSRLSPLGAPRVDGDGLCLEDLGILAGVVPANERTYSYRAFTGDRLTPASVTNVGLTRGHFACVTLPAVPGASRTEPGYVVVDLGAARATGEAAFPARIHLYHLGDGGYRVVGLERPYDWAPPEG